MMAQFLKQSTAYTFQIGPFVDSADGVTPKTSLTIAATDIDISKGGAAYADKHDSTALTGTGDAQGYYDCVLDTTDTGTLGPLDVRCYVSTALPVWQHFMIVPANVWDSLFGADYLQVDLLQILGTALTEGAGQIAASFKQFFNVATPTGTVNSLPDAVAGAASGVAVVGSAMTLAADQAVNATKISGSSTAADNLTVSALAVVIGTAVTGTLTTTAFTTSLSEATDNHYNGRVCVFTSGVLAGQAKAVTSYDGANKALTTRAFTEAPGNGDTFVLV